MPIEKFEDRSLTGSIKVACKYDDGTVRYWEDDKARVIARIQHIVAEYKRDGYVLTLRQLHYQLVTRNWIVNHDSAYKKLSGILDDCKYAGLVDWDSIEDRGRVPFIPYSVDTAQEGMDDLINQFRIDRQEGQNNLVELWTEKDALSGILRRSTKKYHIQLVVNKGYTSSSALYGAYRRIVNAIANEQTFTILYFGDHDPSGLDMIRDIRERLTDMLTNGKLLEETCGSRIEKWWEDTGYTLHSLIDNGYCKEETRKLLYGDLDYDMEDKYMRDWEQGKRRAYVDVNGLFRVVPIGLTMEQIKEHSLPPNPTKLTDTRASKYVKKYGKVCWEVDALKPHILTEIVEKSITENIDIDVFNTALKRELKELNKLKKFKM